jgi:hypothetical protein
MIRPTVTLPSRCIRLDGASHRRIDDLILVSDVADTLVGDTHAALGQYRLDVTQTEAEGVVQPHGITDDLSGKSVTTAGTKLGHHSASSPTSRPGTSPG